ncbi:ABC transporter ATP-binding protein [Pseudomonas panipatensis]|uniref:Amino acid/amide ABC transporter ATP-binding protein 1, HAAT family n=1 Tax=Pseudomonas panipatensis TaxID=428992 RepID=A0A1G8MUX6_9PSED|nr:ABC transporter ATP-binding protein [Pseudomonas panipatensis]SDI71130.1 amino acid/amide ABC transporter ATP-binding protein 1, HAAT family [Pseudomonas panipatensis]SMP78194.1 amino acid/amide ABC transporter ATP-binding protein 1, HAAT family [Pseudomonas panipatensis]
MSTLLEVRDVSLSFQGVKAISALSFAVRQGEICALIGPNGAGKSSLLNILNGVYRADAGELRFDGVPLRRVHPLEAARLGIGRTFQNNALFKKMSVLDNLLTGLSRFQRSRFLEQALGLPRARREAREFTARAERVLEFLELQAWRDVAVGSLAYGLQKRVELGRALIAQPRLLLLDEPMAGMNAEEKREMSRFIADINRDLGTTVVLIEHDIQVVMGLSSHVVVLDYGRKVGDGTPAEVQANPDVIDAYLGRSH